MKPKKILSLTKYGRSGASSRLRSMQYVPWLQQASFDVTEQNFISDEMLQARYGRGSYGLPAVMQAYAGRIKAMLQRKQFDLVWIEKEALPWLPLWLELALLQGVPYVVDYDDAVFHGYDLHPNSWVRKIYGRRLDGLMAKAALVICGNNYLANRARDAGADWVEVLPTVIDLERYPKRLTTSEHTERTPRIVWIGSPSTAQYLQVILPALQGLAQVHPFVLRVIGAGEITLPGVQVECITWSEDSEVEDISACDVGIMPLLDSPWEQGKCGYKLIQYMACGLPVVASGVGVNPEIVDQGVNGLLASTPAQWITALGQLLGNASLRAQMGQAGRLKVEEMYCVQQTGPQLVKLFNMAASGSKTCAV